MLPYGIYSVFHVATYTRTNLIPTLVPTKSAAPQGSPATGAANAKPPASTHPVADAINSFVKEYYDASMSMVSTLEILIWVRLLLSAALFQRRSWILLAIYTAFVRARFAQSVHVQNSFGRLESRIDGFVASQGTPPVARQVWEGVKGGARQFHAATDLGKDLDSASAAAAKKTS